MFVFSPSCSRSVCARRTTAPARTPGGPGRQREELYPRGRRLHGASRSSPGVLSALVADRRGGTDEILVLGTPETPGDPAAEARSTRASTSWTARSSTRSAPAGPVNDLHLLRIESGLRLIHVDVGAAPLPPARVAARRERVDARLFDYQLREHLIAWKYVQPLGHFGRAGQRQVLRLSASHQPLAQLHPAELAEVLEDLDMHKRQASSASLTPEVAADALEQMDTETQVDLIGGDGRGARHARGRGDGHRRRRDLLSELEDEKAETILDGMEIEPRGGRELLTHREDTAGGIMTTDFIALKTGYSVDQTIAVLRQEAQRGREHLLPVRARRPRPPGRCRHAAQPHRVQPERLLADLMSTRVISVTTREDKNAAAELFAKYKFRALPSSTTTA